MAWEQSIPLTYSVLWRSANKLLKLLSERGHGNSAKAYPLLHTASPDVWNLSFGLDRELLRVKQHHSEAAFRLWRQALIFCLVSANAFACPAHITQRQARCAETRAPHSQQHKSLASSQHRFCFTTTTVPSDTYSKIVDTWLWPQTCDCFALSP